MAIVVAINSELFTQRGLAFCSDPSQYRILPSVTRMFTGSNSALARGWHKGPQILV